MGLLSSGFPDLANRLFPDEIELNRVVSVLHYARAGVGIDGLGHLFAERRTHYFFSPLVTALDGGITGMLTRRTALSEVVDPAELLTTTV